MHKVTISIITLILFISACTSEKEPKKLSRQVLIDSLSVFSALPEQAIFPKNNPFSETKKELGKLLFFDPILSGGKDVACATCHHPSYAFNEFRDISIGVNGTGFGQKRKFKPNNSIPLLKRNAPTCINSGFNGITNNKKYDPLEAPMFWDNRVLSLETQALQPILSLEEMRGREIMEGAILDTVTKRLKSVETYMEMFARAFPEENGEITSENISKAIATYERSLYTANTRFDQYLRGEEDALSISEKEGFQLFKDAGCGLCHNGPMLSDYKLHALGVVENKQLTSIDSGAGNHFTFRTPTLRNLRKSAPYMHNGTLPTLMKTMEFYEDIGNGDIKNKNVTKQHMDTLIPLIELESIDMHPIINFLLTLNDELEEAAPKSVPSGLAVGGEIHLGTNLE